MNKQELFEQAIEYPDIELRDRLDSLVGLDDHKLRLAKILGLLVNPDGLDSWAKKFHKEAKKSLNLTLRRPPLVVLAGDVGSGKTELSITIGDLVARQEKIDVTLFPLSLAARGQGRVGEMTQLISLAFDHTFAEATKLKGPSKTNGAIILLIDEADALAQSRELAQMHHEDKAGVNAFIRGIDRLAKSRLPVAVIMCTNRISSLDPAIKRRAAEILTFERPTEQQRLLILSQLTELGISSVGISELSKLTGRADNRDYGFTFSDITQRLIPSIILDAYPNGPISEGRAIEIAKSIIPTQPFNEK